jgi:hypothetical protein
MRLARVGAGMFDMLSSPSFAAPLLGFSRPARQASNVDLPAPLGPRMTLNLLTSNVAFIP